MNGYVIGVVAVVIAFMLALGFFYFSSDKSLFERSESLDQSETIRFECINCGTNNTQQNYIVSQDGKITLVDNQNGYLTVWIEDVPVLNYSGLFKNSTDGIINITWTAHYRGNTSGIYYSGSSSIGTFWAWFLPTDFGYKYGSNFSSQGGVLRTTKVRFNWTAYPDVTTIQDANINSRIYISSPRLSDYYVFDYGDAPAGTIIELLGAEKVFSNVNQWEVDPNVGGTEDGFDRGRQLILSDGGCQNTHTINFLDNGTTGTNYIGSFDDPDDANTNRTPMTIRTEYIRDVLCTGGSNSMTIKIHTNGSCTSPVMWTINPPTPPIGTIDIRYWNQTTGWSAGEKCVEMNVTVDDGVLGTTSAGDLGKIGIAPYLDNPAVSDTLINFFQTQTLSHNLGSLDASNISTLVYNMRQDGTTTPLYFTSNQIDSTPSTSATLRMIDFNTNPTPNLNQEFVYRNWTVSGFTHQFWSTNSTGAVARENATSPVFNLTNVIQCNSLVNEDGVFIYNRGERTNRSGSIADVDGVAWSETSSVAFDVQYRDATDTEQFDNNTFDISSGSWDRNTTIPTTATANDTLFGHAYSMRFIVDNDVDTGEFNLCTYSNALNISRRYQFSSDNIQFDKLMRGDTERVNATLLKARGGSATVPKDTNVTIRYYDPTPTAVYVSTRNTTDGITANFDQQLSNSDKIGTWQLKYEVLDTTTSNLGNNMPETDGGTFILNNSINITSIDYNLAGETDTQLKIFNYGERINFTGTLRHFDGGFYRVITPTGSTPRSISLEAFLNSYGSNFIVNATTVNVNDGSFNVSIPVNTSLSNTYASSIPNQTEAREYDIRIFDGTSDVSSATNGNDGNVTDRFDVANLIVAGSVKQSNDNDYNPNATIYNRGERSAIDFYLTGARNQTYSNKVGVTVEVLTDTNAVEDSQSLNTDTDGKISYTYVIADDDKATLDYIGSSKNLRITPLDSNAQFETNNNHNVSYLYNVTVRFDKPKFLIGEDFTLTERSRNVRGENLNAITTNVSVINPNGQWIYNNTITTVNGIIQYTAGSVKLPIGTWSANITAYNPLDYNNNTLDFANTQGLNINHTTLVGQQGRDPLEVLTASPYKKNQSRQWIGIKPMTIDGFLVDNTSTASCPAGSTCIQDGNMKIFIYYPNGSVMVNNENPTYNQPSDWSYNWSIPSNAPTGTYRVYVNATTSDGSIWAGSNVMQVWECLPEDANCQTGGGGGGGLTAEQNATLYAIYNNVFDGFHVSEPRCRPNMIPTGNRIYCSLVLEYSNGTYRNDIQLSYQIYDSNLVLQFFGTTTNTGIFGAYLFDFLPTVEDGYYVFVYNDTYKISDINVVFLDNTTINYLKDINRTTIQINNTVNDTNSYLKGFVTTALNTIDSVVDGIQSFLNGVWGDDTAETIKGNVTSNVSGEHIITRDYIDSHNSTMTTQHDNLNVSITNSTIMVNSTAIAEDVWKYLLRPNLNTGQALNETFRWRFPIT